MLGTLQEKGRGERTRCWSSPASLSGSLAASPAPPAGFTLLGDAMEEPEEGQATPGVGEASGQLSKPGLSLEFAGQALAGQSCSLRGAKLPGGFLKIPISSLLPLPIPK